jgi:hypothetical protein
VLLDLGDPVAGAVEQLPTVLGWKDQLRPSVTRIWTAFQVTELLQLADQLGGAVALRHVERAGPEPGSRVRSPWPVR